jgi:hypothetical protein
VLRIRDVYPGSRILICTHPGSRISDLGSRIQDPKKTTKERGEKKLSVKPFYVAKKFNKIVNYFSFEVLKKKMWGNFQRIIVLFTKKIVIKLFEIWSWDPGSEIRDLGSGKKPFRIPDPGSRGQKGTGSRIRIRIRNTAYKHELSAQKTTGCTTLRTVVYRTVLYCMIPYRYV